MKNWNQLRRNKVPYCVNNFSTKPLLVLNEEAIFFKEIKLKFPHGFKIENVKKFHLEFSRKSNFHSHDDFNAVKFQFKREIC